MEAARIPWRPLGRLLVEQGLLSEDELERALEQQALTGRRLGETLVDLEFVSHPALSRALAEQYGIELKTEQGFGTGLRAEIERRHDRDREGGIEPRPQTTSETAPPLALVPEPEPSEPHAFDGDNLYLTQLEEQLEEQWAKLAAAEERLAEAERELTGVQRMARHRRGQAERLVARIRKRDHRIAELSADHHAAAERLAEAERELTRVERIAGHRREQAERLVARIRKRDHRIDELSANQHAAAERRAEGERELTDVQRKARHRREQAERLVARIRERDHRIAELSADQQAAEERLAEAERELTGVQRMARHRREQAERLVARIRGRDRRIAQLSDERDGLAQVEETTPSQPDGPASRGHLIYAQLAGRYELLERDGAAPEPDAMLELPEVGDETVIVDRVGRSPLPNDARPCAFAHQVNASGD